MTTVRSRGRREPKGPPVFRPASPPAGRRGRQPHDLVVVDTMYAAECDVLVVPGFGRHEGIQFGLMVTALRRVCGRCSCVGISQELLADPPTHHRAFPTSLRIAR